MCLVAITGVACDSSPPPPTPEECSTGNVWSGGDEESPLMHPGGDCIGCHSAEGEGPIYTAAGTVMAAYDDPEDCYGVEGVLIRLTDADGNVHEATTNAAGNFFFAADVSTPFTAEIERDGVTSAMLTPQVDGNCASCHTEVGENGAPGRILVPGSAP
jgi:hypothetical protein